MQRNKGKKRNIKKQIRKKDREQKKDKITNPKVKKEV